MLTTRGTVVGPVLLAVAILLVTVAGLVAGVLAALTVLLVGPFVGLGINAFLINLFQGILDSGVLDSLLG
jgi:hypothetical protein